MNLTRKNTETKKLCKSKTVIDKMATVNFYLSIITLNANRSNSPIKRQKKG